MVRMSTRLVFVTCPDPAVAVNLAKSLVEERLAACGNVLPGVRSIYRWEGAVHDGAECLLLLKTTAAGYPALEARVKALHPYDVPEIIAVKVEGGLPAYLQWVADSLQPPREL
jgi:periplasmic divalent cation tolerance protein